MRARPRRVRGPQSQVRPKDGGNNGPLRPVGADRHHVSVPRSGLLSDIPRPSVHARCAPALARVIATALTGPAAPVGPMSGETACVMAPSRMLPASALLLDMDGVLVDSTGDVLKHWMQWADRRGVDPAEVARHAHGAPSREVVARFVPAEEVDAEADWVEQLSLREREEHALPGAARLLGQRELPVAVATSATGRVARLRLRNAGLPIPDVLVTADDVARGKPDPQPYLKAARQLGVPPERCVGVDDTPAGLASLIAAGATPIAVATTYPAGELGAALAVLPDLYNIRIVEGGIVWTRAAEAAARPDA